MYTAIAQSFAQPSFEELLEESTRIHGHICAGQVIGVRMAMIGLREIRELLARKTSILQCVAAIQQATRRYAKRQLTWFRRQTSFEPLNLSLFSHNEAVKWILQRAQRSFAHRDD